MPGEPTGVQLEEEEAIREGDGEDAEHESLLGEADGLSRANTPPAMSNPTQIPTRDEERGGSQRGRRRARVIVALLMMAAAGGIVFSLGASKTPAMHATKQDSSVADIGADGYGDLDDFDNFSTAELRNYSIPYSIPIPHTPPKQIYLLGERNSGTKYVESILKGAFYPQYGTSGSYPFAGCSQSVKPPQKGCIPVFRFKHMFRHKELNEMELEELRTSESILWVLVVRSPCDWADAMYREPWHMCPPGDTARCQGIHIGLNKGALEGVDRASFFSLPWRDNAESENGPNYTYPNVFCLRTHKLKLMMQLIRVAPHRISIVHLKSVEKDPEGFIQDIATQFKVNISSGHKQQASTKRHRSLCLTDDEWITAQSEIDWELEGRFGFNALDCHSCVRR